MVRTNVSADTSTFEALLRVYSEEVLDPGTCQHLIKTLRDTKLGSPTGLSLAHAAGMNCSAGPWGWGNGVQRFVPKPCLSVPCSFGPSENQPLLPPYWLTLTLPTP